MRCSSVDAPLHQGLKDPNHRILETHGSGFLSETPAMAGGWSVQIQTLNHSPTAGGSDGTLLLLLLIP